MVFESNGLLSAQATRDILVAFQEVKSESNGRDFILDEAPGNIHRFYIASEGKEKEEGELLWVQDSRQDNISLIMDVSRLFVICQERFTLMRIYGMGSDIDLKTLKPFLQPKGEGNQCGVYHGEFEDAVIAHIVGNWYEHTRKCIDRTALQRFMYFLKVSGVPLAINHRIDYYGPYSYEVTDRVEWLEIRDVIEDNNPNRRLQYPPGSNAHDPITEYRQELVGFGSNTNNVMRELTWRSPRETELLAFVSFVRGTAMREDDDSDERTIREIKRIKGRKFESQEIEDAIAYLKNSMMGLRRREVIFDSTEGHQAQYSKCDRSG
jgi:hypothetical protein